MNKTTTAVAAAALFAAVTLSREAGGGRKLASALEWNRPGDLTFRSLRRSSAALQRHLKHNPRDLLAAQLLNDVDTEIVRRK